MVSRVLWVIARLFLRCSECVAMWLLGCFVSGVFQLFSGPACCCSISCASVGCAEVLSVSLRLQHKRT